VSIFDVRYQPRAHKILQRALASGRVPHAYLFHGPDGVGKELLAERLARLLLCGSPISVPRAPLAELQGFDGPVRDACEKCQDCVLTVAGTHPDYHLIYRELHKHHPEPEIRKRKGTELGVDVIRHFVIEAVGNKPACGRAKVFVIREADRISSAAQNALLKTLEEPPGTTFLILLAAGLDKLLPTTKSRCQRVPFGPLPIEFVATRLRELVPDLPAETAASYAAWSQGSLGRAKQYSDDNIASIHAQLSATLERLGTTSVTDVADQWMETAKALSGQFRTRDPEISDTEAQRRALTMLFGLVAAWFGDGLRAAVGSSGAEVGRSAPPPAGGAVRPGRAGIGPRQAAGAIKAVLDAERNLECNAAVQLVVEALVTRLSRAAVAGRA
jgi:DNA polymerase III subunit delta'